MSTDVYRCVNSLFDVSCVCVCVATDVYGCVNSLFDVSNMWMCRLTRTGVLTRCLVSLEQKDIDGSKSTETSDALREVL